MASKTSWRRYGTKSRHCHAMCTKRRHLTRHIISCYIHKMAIVSWPYQSCPWVHFVWPDPTQPMGQPNPWTTLDHTLRDVHLMYFNGTVHLANSRSAHSVRATWTRFERSRPMRCVRRTRACSAWPSTRTVACRSTIRTWSCCTRASDATRRRLTSSPSPTTPTATCCRVSAVALLTVHQ